MGLTFNLGRLSPSIFTDASNNVGIGGSPSGSYKLEVTGTINATKTLTLRGQTDPTSGVGMELFYRSADTSSYLQSYDRTSSAWKDVRIYGNALYFGSQGSNHLTINTSGNVGIGASPLAKFFVNIATNQNIRFSQESSQACISVVNDLANAFGVLKLDGSTLQLNSQTLGNVLIGTTSSNGSKLQVNGSVNATEFSAANDVTLTKAGANGIGDGPFYRFINSTNASQFLRQLNASSGEDLWTYNTTTIWTKVGNTNAGSGVYTALSDINKKKDFELSTLGIDAILGLKPTLYRMKSEDENVDKQLGFIAQEVQEFIPQAYIEQGEEDGKFIGLNYNAITATLVKAVQELSAQNQDLKSRLDKAGL